MTRLMLLLYVIMADRPVEGLDHMTSEACPFFSNEILLWALAW